GIHATPAPTRVRAFPGGFTKNLPVRGGPGGGEMWEEIGACLGKRACSPLKSDQTNTLLCRCVFISYAVDFQRKSRRRSLMNEASAWRYALAQKLAPYYCANPKVAAVAVEGSVARGYADGSSDIDLVVFWTKPPTEKQRRDIIKHARGRRWKLASYNVEEGCWLEQFEVAGVAIDVRHIGIETTERMLADVLEHCDPSLAKQRRIAALLSALPLSDPSVLIQWQQQARVYPRELSVAMVQSHLRFRPAWEQEMLAERNDLLVLYESFCRIEKDILLVLMGLNHTYYPGLQCV